MKKEIPVYLFTGFLGAGKTTFIQDTLESEDFLTEECTLFLVCEEGEVEYEPKKFYDSDIHIEVVENEADLTTEYMDKMADKYDADAVIVEYNGMWMLDTLYANLPQNWYVNQEMTFIESPMFMTYNQNMRQQVFDKLKSAELVVFNRFDHGWDKLPYHKIVRVANRKSQIVYEFGPDDVEPDIFQDPLPYDMNAPVVVIKDEDYAEFYRDLNENMKNYGGKTMKIKGRAVTGQDIPDARPPVERIPPAAARHGDGPRARPHPHTGTEEAAMRHHGLQPRLRLAPERRVGALVRLLRRREVLALHNLIPAGALA